MVLLLSTRVKTNKMIDLNKNARIILFEWLLWNLQSVLEVLEFLALQVAESGVSANKPNNSLDHNHSSNK